MNVKSGAAKSGLTAITSTFEKSLPKSAGLPTIGLPNIRVIKDGTIFETAAKTIASKLAQAIKDRGQATIAFAGGRSAASLCVALKRHKIDWAQVHLFMIDERLVPISDEQSNFKIINDTLISTLLKENKLSRSNVHPFIYDPSRPDGGAAHYTDELAQVGGVFDVIFVSAGEDGHMAGLYPRHPLLNETSAYFATFHDSPKPPADRMTALSVNFSLAQFSILLVVGESKREAIDKLRDPAITPKECPAKLVAASHTHLILTDLSK